MKTQLQVLFNATVLASSLSVLIVGCSKPQDPMMAAPATSTVGTVIDDSVITTEVKAALLADPDVRSFEVKVETRKGEVMLSGYVENTMQIERAAAVARSIMGVKTLQNNMSLKGGATTAGMKLDDSVVTTKVKAALLGDNQVKSRDIAVVTLKGEVQLSGFVDSQKQIDRALVVATGVEGVSRVNNEMSVKK